MLNQDPADAGNASNVAAIPASDAAPDGATPPDTARAIPITLAMAPEITAQRFENQGPMDFTVLVDGFVENPARVGEKDGPCFIPGSLIDDSKPAGKRDSNRTAKNLASLSMMVFDLDAGQDIDSVITALETRGYAALLYASHNDEATATKIEGRDEYIRAAKAAGEDVESLSFAAAYLTERRKLTPEMAATISVVEDTAKAIVITHAPSSRFRVMMPLTEPFVFAAKGVVHADQQALWKRYYAAVAHALGFFCDVACKDVARGFYLPSRPPKTRDRRAIYVPGRGLDLSEFEVAPIEERRPTAAKSGDGEKVFAEIDGRKINLKWFWKAGGSSLNLASVLEAYDAEAHSHKRKGNGLECACPFEGDHSEANNQFWCQNPADTKQGDSFAAFCHHGTCKSLNRDKLEYLKGFIETGRIPLEALEDEANYSLQDGVDFSGVVLALGVDPRGPEPEPTLPPEIEVNDPFASMEEAMAVIDGMKTSTLLNGAIKIVHRVGASKMFLSERTQVLTKIATRTRLARKDLLEPEMERAMRLPNPAHEEWLRAGLKAVSLAESEPGYEFLQDTNYVARDGMIREVVSLGDDRVVYDPICRVFRAPFKSCDERSNDWGLVIQFENDKGEPKETVIGQGELHRDSFALRERLAKLGLDPVPGAKLELMLYSVYRNVPEIITNFTRCGWHGPHTFAAPNGVVISTDPAMESARIAKSACWKETGTPGDFETWQANIDRLAEIGEGFALSAGVALAGPLIQLLKEPINRGGNNTGIADAGKTSTQLSAASFWSSPVLGQGAVQAALATLNGFESVAKIANGTYLGIDETKLIKDDRDFAKLVFMLAQGQEKRRQNAKSELRDSASWSMTFLISSERNSRQIVNAGGEEIVAGQYRRVVDVIFDKSDAHEKDAEEVKRILTKVLPNNWGHGGPRYVRWLIENGHSADTQEVETELSRQRAHLIAGVKDLPSGLNVACSFYAFVRVGAIYGAKAGVISAATRDRCLAAADRFWKRFATTEEAKALDPGKRAVESFLFYLASNVGKTGHAVGAEMEDDVRKVAATVYWYDANRFVIPRAKLGEIIGNVPEEAFLKALRATDCIRFWTKNQGEGRVSKSTFWPAHPDDWGPFPALIIDRAKMGFHLTGARKAESDLPSEAGEETAPLEDAGATPVKRGDPNRLQAFAEADAKRR